MSVNSEITRIRTAVSSAYDAVDDMGGTLPVSEVIASLANAIRTIPTGIDGDEIGYGDLGLVGTWYFVENPSLADFPSGATFYLNFASNSQEYTELRILGTSVGRIYYRDTNGDTAAYTFIINRGAWENQAFRTITITGGDDVKDADLTAWLEANATRI